jgi:iron complex transport system substrate-binding protein
MTFNAKNLLLALAFGLSSALAYSAPQLKIEHASGSTMVVKNPKKVLVLDVGVLDTLDAMNVKVAGVPTWALPAHLAKYAGHDYLKIGSAFEPDYEAISAAAPDLILISGRTHDKYEKLSHIAPTVDLTIDFEHYYASVEHNARALGQIFDKQALVNERISKLEQSIARLHKQGEIRGRALVILTTGGKMSAYGPGSRFGNIYGAFGFKPADASLKPAIHGQSIAYEYLLKTNPDWLFVVDRDVAIGSRQAKPAQRLLDNPLVAQTRAARLKHIVYLDPTLQYVTNGSLRAEQAIVDEISAVLAKK